MNTNSTSYYHKNKLDFSFKVFMLHVGNQLERVSPLQPKDNFFLRKSLLDNKYHYYFKSDIVNADTQMNSIIAKGVQVEYGHLSSRKSIFSLIKAGIKIYSISKRDDIDLIHVLWGSTTALITIIFSKKPVVISFCGSDLLGRKTGEGKIALLGRINSLISKVSAMFASAIITKSNDMKLALWPVVHSKTFVVPNGIEIEKFFPMDINNARKAIGIKHDNPIILFFYTEGAFVKNKNLALEVYSLVKKIFPNAELMVLSGIPHNMLIDYYNASNVMILTSFHEGSNNSIKEAIACNLPVVSVNVGDVRERLEGVENSFVIDNWNATLMAQKVIEVLHSGKRSNGSIYAGNISTDFIAERVIAVYERVLEKTKASHKKIYH